MTQSAFVTGATGFVGSHIARDLCRQGWEVHVLARETSSLSAISDVPVRVHIGDVTDAVSVRAAIPQEVDGVFHVAASTNLWARNNDQQTRINLDGTRNLLDAAATAGARRFIHTSSFAAWGTLDNVFSEDSPRTDATDWINYVRTKHLSEQTVLEAAGKAEGWERIQLTKACLLLAENLIAVGKTNEGRRVYRLDAVVLNPGNVLGPGDRHNWSRLFRMVHAGSLPGAPPGGGNFCDVREVARAHVTAWHKGQSGHRYLLGGEFATYLEVIRLAGEMLDRRVPGKPSPGWLLKVVARIKSALAILTGKEPNLTPEAAVIATSNMRCDSGKAQQELGYRFVPLRDMVRDTIDWMHQEGLLQ